MFYSRQGNACKNCRRAGGPDYLAEVEVSRSDGVGLNVGLQGTNLVPAVQPWGVPPHLGIEGTQRKEILNIPRKRILKSDNFCNL